MRNHIARYSPGVQLFCASCFMLFFEILMIRWISAEVRLFSYFHNLVLLFAFLGVGLGVACSRFRPNSLLISYVLMAVLAILVRLDQFKDVSDLLSQGTRFLIWWQPSPLPLRPQIRALITGYAGFIIAMGMITVFFIPFGQILGKLFEQHRSALRAYGLNLAGSLVGIWLFDLLSILSLPPPIWFGLGGLACLPLLANRRQVWVAALLVGLACLVLRDESSAERWTVWSPYQKLTVVPESTTIDGQRVRYGYQILVNSVGYMQITNYSPGFVQRFPSAFPTDEVPYDHYNMPYRFTDTVDDILVVGSGAGNDVAAAIRNGAHRVDAVDIDPSIIEIGRALHPESPYDQASVTVFNDDARSFFKKAAKQYDMIVFGLLDSHTLSSSYSNVRLDNYVYTIESFREAKRLLKPSGVVVVMFEVADDFIGARLHQELALVFGQRPVSFQVRSGFRGWGGTGFVVGDEAVIATRLAADQRLMAIVDKSKATSERWANSPVRPATDDWPYLYLDGRSVPLLYFLVLGTLVLFSIGGVSVALGRRQPIKWPFFFLGAGFLLLEVQNISKVALLFGATWTVTALVISAILIMLFVANFYATRVQPASLWYYYVALFLAFAVNLVAPISILGGLPTFPKVLLVGVLVGLPIFLGGVIFSTSFAATHQPASALASNLLGAMVGGVLETASFVTGIQSLLILAALLYLVSWLVLRTHTLRTPLSAG